MRHLSLGALGALTLMAATASPLLAKETVEQCENRVIFECDAALEESNWAEKIAVGIVCSARLLACSGVNVTVRVF
jgi:hypothetical protein